jgi:hypothetical protein
VGFCGLTHGGEAQTGAFRPTRLCKDQDGRRKRRCEQQTETCHELPIGAIGEGKYARHGSHNVQVEN